MDSREVLIDRLIRFYREAGGEVSSIPPAWVPGKRRTVRWLQPALASIALVAVAVGLAVSFRIVRDQAERKVTIVPPPSASPSPSPSPSETPSPTPSPTATPTWVTRKVPIGSVLAMSLDTSAVFALYDPGPTNGRSDPAQTKLARIDRTMGAVTTAGPFPNAWQLARSAAGLWVAAGAEQWAPTADTEWLTLVDPVTLKVKQRVQLPGRPTSGTYSSPHLAGTADLLWLGYGNSLFRLDPATGRVLLTQSLAGSVTSIAIDPSGRRLYTGVVPAGTGSALVIEWDASTGGRIASATTGGGDLGGPTLAGAPDGVWIAYATGMMGAVEHRSAVGLTLFREPQGQHANGIHVFVGGGALWLVDSMAQQVTCADLRTGTAAATVHETLPSAIVADAKGSYLGDADGVGFLRPDPSCPH
jgi:sugar lactone lactonase YvrE